MKHPVAVDFETFRAESRPDYPPVPVGVSIQLPGQKARYFSWGHVEGNNCSWIDAKNALRSVWNQPLLFHHAKFDLAVASEHFDLPIPPIENIHDTMFLAFLDDPNRRALGLKELAVELLDEPPEERDALADWLVSHQPVPGIRISDSISSQAKHPFGAYIPYAPGGVTGAYANGDTNRTRKLFNKLWPSINDREMATAYRRELRLLKVLLEIEPQGIRVDLERLAKDCSFYRRLMLRIDGWVAERLNAPDLNLDSGAQLIQALITKGEVDRTRLLLTEKGNLSSGADSLRLAMKDRAFAEVLAYRSSLKTALGTFMENWLDTAQRGKGRIFTDWHQTRGAGGGARTGRLSSHPNFQNIPVIDEETIDLKLAGKLLRLPALPIVRSYIIPDEGHIFVDADFAQQEPRILAHFENGQLMQQYQENPWFDVHDEATEKLAAVGLHYKRKPVKIINLGLIYAKGIGLLSEETGLPVDETRQLKRAILGLYPGLKELNENLATMAANGEPLITWGGRENYCEKPSIVKGKIMTWEYKMINTLIQGSAADATKEAICRYHEEYKKKDERLKLNVHDQLTASVPQKDVKGSVKRLKAAMESLEFDVPMLTEVKVGKDWGNLIEYDKKGVVVYGA